MNELFHLILTTRQNAICEEVCGKVESKKTSPCSGAPSEEHFNNPDIDKSMGQNASLSAEGTVPVTDSDSLSIIEILAKSWHHS